MLFVKHSSDHLAMIREPITDADLFLYVLDGLNRKFRDFVTGMLLRTNITDIDEPHHLLLLYERCDQTM